MKQISHLSLIAEAESVRLSHYKWLAKGLTHRIAIEDSKTFFIFKLIFNPLVDILVLYNYPVTNYILPSDFISF